MEQEKNRWKNALTGAIASDRRETEPDRGRRFMYDGRPVTMNRPQSVTAFIP